MVSHYAHNMKARFTDVSVQAASLRTDGIVRPITKKAVQDKMAGLLSVTSKAQAIQDESVICSRCGRFRRIRRISSFAFEGSCFGGPWFERALAIGACVLDTQNG